MWWERDGGVASKLGSWLGSWPGAWLGSWLGSWLGFWLGSWLFRKQIEIDTDRTAQRAEAVGDMGRRRNLL